MESKFAQQLRKELIAATRALATSEQRLESFLEHCQHMAELYDPGGRLRAETDSKQP